MFGKRRNTTARIDIQRAIRMTEAHPGSLAAQRNKRRSERSPRWAECAVTYPGGYQREGVVLDMSVTGARVRFRTQSSMPQWVLINIAKLNIEQRAEVVWQTDHECGLRFVEPLTATNN